MKTHHAFFFAAVIGGLFPSTTAAQVPLPELAAKVGQPFSRPRVRELSPTITLEVLAREADLVVHGIVTPVSTHLSADQKAIYTDYGVTLKRVIAAAAPQRGTKPGNVDVVFTHYGGTMILNGVQVDCIDESLPPFKAGAEVVVFLKQNAASEVYDLVYAVGAFGVEGGRLKPLTRPALSLESVRGTSIPEFAERIVRARVP